MGLHNEVDDSYSFNEFSYEDEKSEELNHRKQVRKLLEQRLEEKRLREELDELDGEFDWDDLDK